MIEFKADCGHTVRAKDDDAGKAVRCAYCGREAAVPDDERDELDFLFSEVGEKTSSGSGSAKVGRKAAAAAGMPFTPRSQSDPFNVIKKMAYVAAFLICAIFVGKKYVWPMISDAIEGEQRQVATADPKESEVRTPTRPLSTSRPSPRKTSRNGFIKDDLSAHGDSGVYVLPVPDDVIVYYCDADESKEGFDWVLPGAGDNEVSRVDGARAIKLDPGSYTFVAMVAVNNSHFMRRYEAWGYIATRKKIEDAKIKEGEVKSDSPAIREIDRFFRPDASEATGVMRIRGRVHIARRYSVRVDVDKWSMLAPLFLPYIGDLARTVELLPSEQAFKFNEQDIRTELDYYEVDPKVQTYIGDILGRVGTISYRMDDNKMQLFRIDPMDGAFIAVALDGVTRRADAYVDAK